MCRPTLSLCDHNTNVSTQQSPTTQYDHIAMWSHSKFPPIPGWAHSDVITTMWSQWSHECSLHFVHILPTCSSTQVRVSLTIDCPPGRARPDTLIASVLEGIADATVYGDTESRRYGAWVWSFDIASVSWPAQRDTIFYRMEALLSAGAIRYGACSDDPVSLLYDVFVSKRAFFVVRHRLSIIVKPTTNFCCVLFPWAPCTIYARQRRNPACSRKHHKSKLY